MDTALLKVLPYPVLLQQLQRLELPLCCPSCTLQSRLLVLVAVIAGGAKEKAAAAKRFFFSLPHCSKRELALAKAS